MAILTIDEILNHDFPRTKFKEGFDPDAVDEFLDRVIESMVLLQEENSELKAKLETAERRLAEVGEDSLAGTEPPAQPVSEVDQVNDAPTPVEPVVMTDPTPADAVQSSEPSSATSMLALAQRVHDEYVADGREEGDRIIAESREKAGEIVRKAEDERASVMRDLESKRQELEDKIEELKNFERNYRSQMRSHLETLLNNLEQGSTHN